MHFFTSPAPVEAFKRILSHPQVTEVGLKHVFSRPQETKVGFKGVFSDEQVGVAGTKRFLNGQ